MRTILILLGLTFPLSAFADATTQSRFHFSEAPGPYQIGIKIVYQYDYSRTFQSATDALGKPFLGERARPIQTLIWYPALPSVQKPMTVGDYASLLASETRFQDPYLSVEEKKKWIDGMAPSLALPLHAIRDASMEAGHFPVVIYAPSFSAPSWENADLCEYLASYGYVVIAGPGMGNHTREMTPDLVGIGAQAQDISFLIGYARTLPDTDMSEIAVGGFSWGGMSNLFAAARDSRIDALFCLDGSLRYFPSLVQESGDVHPDQMTIPLIYFTEGNQSLEELSELLPKNTFEMPNVLNEWLHGDLIEVNMAAMVHWEYSSMYQRDEYMWQTEYNPQQKLDYERNDGITGYAWMAKYVLSFLEAYLKHNSVAMESLKRVPVENGIPKHFMNIRYRSAVGEAPSLEAFRIELGRKGFDHVAEVYNAMLEAYPKFQLSDSEIETWTEDMVISGHSSEAIEVLQWNAAVKSKSSEAYSLLGDAYRLKGQKKPAIDAYQKALKLAKDEPVLQQQILELKIRSIGEPDFVDFHR